MHAGWFKIVFQYLDRNTEQAQATDENLHFDD